MKKRIKALLAAFAAAAILACSTASAYADKVKTVDGLLYRYSDSGESKGVYTGWVKKGADRYYYKNGKMLKSCWLTVKGKKTYYLRKNGKMAVGTIKTGGKYYAFDEKGRLDEYGGDTGGAASGASLSERGITTKGTAITADEIKELVEREKVNIASFIRLETPGAGDINISLVGYSHLQTDDNTISLDFVTLPVFSDNKIIGDVTLFRYDGEIHYTPSAGGTGWAVKTKMFSENPDKEITFVYCGQYMELMIAPDDTIYKMWDGETPLDGVSDRYAKYATEYNTFSFPKMIAEKNYVTVPADVSNITLCCKKKPCAGFPYTAYTYDLSL